MAGLVAFLVLATALLRAQTPVQEVTIRSHPYILPSAILRAEANLVEAPLTVRDSQGRTIAGLRASDFEVLDNGVPQKIVGFSELHAGARPGDFTASVSHADDVPAAALPPPVPKFVTFFFDDAHLSNADMLFAVRGAHRFIAKGLKPTDWTSIVTTSGQGDLDFTTDASLFSAKLDKLASHTRPAMGGGCGSLDPDESYIFVHRLDYQVIEKGVALAKPCACGDQERESICRPRAMAAAESAAISNWEQTQAESVNTIFALGFAAKKLHESNGTRILVLTSAGFLVRAGQPELERFIDGAVRWNIVIHAIDARGLNPIRGSGESRTAAMIQFNSWMPLEKLTDGTGGHFFKNSNDLAGAMDLAANPEVSYLLAFNPGQHDGEFHKLKIRFKSKRPDSVQFRPGYYSPRDEPEPKQTARGPFDAAVFSKETLHEVPAAVSISTAKASVSVSIVVDLNRLQFTSANGRHAQQIVFLMTLLDPAGGFVTGKEAIMDLALTDERLASLQKTGLKAVATLNAPAGAYQVRTIVREAMKGDLAASTIPVELR
jgi:VWFA-related protein